MFKISYFSSLIVVFYMMQSESASLEKRRADPEELTVPAKRVRTDLSRFATEEKVSLLAGKGSKKTGGGVGGFFWHVNYLDKKVGKVFINWINEKPLGEHASIQIYLNKQSQGKHIGRFAYSKACELSSYDVIYAHISKSNKASKKAAEAAGFKVFSTAGQLIMKWMRKK